MALTKIGKEGITGISNSANATFLTVDSSEQAVIKSEGGAVTTSVQQGLAKAWLRMNGDNTPAINDSLNITSIADQATGNYRVTIANDMANATYSATTGAGGATSNNTLMNCATPGDALGAGTIDLDLQYEHQTANDPEVVSFALHGDLA